MIISTALLQLSALLISHQQSIVAHAASFRGGVNDPIIAVEAAETTARRRNLESNPCTGLKNKNCNAPTCDFHQGNCVLVTSTTIEPTTSPTTANPTDAPTPEPGPLTCPQQHCAAEVVNTAPTVDSSVVCPDLAAVTLATYEHEGVVLIELTGPASMANAADLVITSPHGGDLKPEFVADRTTNYSCCPSSGCKTSKDSYTLQISELLQSKFISNYCKVPFVVKNHLHRSKLDANREVCEAAQDDTIAMDAWTSFHTFINDAQTSLEAHFGSITVQNSGGSSITGAKALLFDMHGYAGLDWVPTDGSPFIQWGYRLSDDPSLNPESYCPLDTRSSGTIGTMTHARWMAGESHGYECLVRGPGSLGSRVAGIVNANPGRLGTTNQNSMCGFGTPSYEYESPWHVANNPVHCDKIADGGSECHYYSGGYDVEVHERMDWENISGDHFNTVQAELPRCIRFGGTAVREEFADVLSVAVMSFLRDLYGPLP